LVGDAMAQIIKHLKQKQNINFVTISFGNLLRKISRSIFSTYTSNIPSVTNDNIVVYDNSNYYVLVISEWLTERKTKALWHKFTKKDYPRFLLEYKKPFAVFDIISLRREQDIYDLNYNKIREDINKRNYVWLLTRKRFLNLKETKNFKIIDTPSISVTY
jgi:hypothetical protein